MSVHLWLCVTETVREVHPVSLAFKSREEDNGMISSDVPFKTNDSSSGDFPAIKREIVTSSE